MNLTKTLIISILSVWLIALSAAIIVRHEQCSQAIRADKNGGFYLNGKHYVIEQR